MTARYKLLTLPEVAPGQSLPELAYDVTATTVVLGAASECAQIVWNGPGETRPRCDGDASRLACK